MPIVERIELTNEDVRAFTKVATVLWREGGQLFLDLEDVAEHGLVVIFTDPRASRKPFRSVSDLVGMATEEEILTVAEATGDPFE